MIFQKVEVRVEGAPLLCLQHDRWVTVRPVSGHLTPKMNRVKRPLLARFDDNLTEITCVKERVVEFFSLKLSALLRDVVQLV